MTIKKLLKKMFGTPKKEESISIRALPRGESPEKRELYKRALEGAAIDQKKIIAEYDKKFV